MIAPNGQLTLFSETWAERAAVFANTPEGHQVLNRFIRIAWGCRARGVKIGAKAIWERLRWHYTIARADSERFKLNNNYCSYFARFAIAKEPRLAEVFNFRKTGADSKPVKAVVIPICRRSVSRKAVSL